MLKMVQVMSKIKMSKSKLQFPGIDHEFTMKNKIKVISVNSAKKKELEKKTSAAKLKELNT